MDLLLLIVVLLSLVLALLAVVLVVLLKRRKRWAFERQELGMQYARLGVRYSIGSGHPPGSPHFRAHAVGGFKLADETADGKRDFSDQQAGLYVDAAIAELSKS